MKKKEFLTEAKRKAIISDKEKAIIESFAKTFNKIKRIDENEIGGPSDNDKKWEEEQRRKYLQNQISQGTGGPTSDEEMNTIMAAMAMKEDVSTADDKLNQLVGTPISLIKTKHTVKYNPERGENDKVTLDEPINGVIGEIGDFEGIKGLTVTNEQGRKIAFLMYDRKRGEFVEGDSSFSYTYKGADEQSDRILKFILRYLVGVNSINEYGDEDYELEDRKQQYGINPEIDPADLDDEMNEY